MFFSYFEINIQCITLQMLTTFYVFFQQYFNLSFPQQNDAGIFIYFSCSNIGISIQESIQQFSMCFLGTFEPTDDARNIFVYSTHFLSFKTKFC